MPQEDWSRVDAMVKQVLADNGGVAKMAAFLRAGLTNRQVAAVLGRGVLERPRSGWYCDPTIPWEGKHAIRVGGVLSCSPAAASYGVATPPRSGIELHVLVALNSARIRHHKDKRHYVVPGEDRDVRLHWSTTARRYRGWRTSLVETLLMLADCVPFDWWIAALDSAVHRPRDGGDPILSDEEFAVFVALVPGRLRHALELIDGRAESPIETLIRLGLIRRGIGPITLQFSPDRRREVDLLVGTRVLVEADGLAFHDPERDAVRDAYFRSLGYIVLRFPYRRIIDDLDSVLDEIEAALASA